MPTEFDGYVARVSDMKSYFDENMRLLQDGSMDALFATRAHLHEDS